MGIRKALDIIKSAARLKRLLDSAESQIDARRAVIRGLKNPSEYIINIAVTKKGAGLPDISDLKDTCINWIREDLIADIEEGIILLEIQIEGFTNQLEALKC